MPRSSEPPEPAPTLLIAGGGTGGHLYPGVAVAQELRARNPHWRIVFVGTARGIEVRAVPKAGFELELLAVQPLRGRGVAGLMRGLLAVPLACLQAWRLIRGLRPVYALGVGGYAAGPALLVARLMAVPTAIMEQNAHAGLTNRLLARTCRHIFLALPNGQLGARPNACVVGNPVRAELVALGLRPTAEAVAFTQERPLRLLVVGGSQGAHALNTTLMALLPKLAGLPIALRHQTGQKDAARVAAAYAAHPHLTARVEPFIDDMAQAYGEADVVLCRAGASTLAELAVVGLPAVLVPYPAAADDHQTANAQVAEQAGWAILLRQPALTPDAVLAHVQQWLKAPSALAHMAARARAAGKPKSVAVICDTIEAEVNRV